MKLLAASVFALALGLAAAGCKSRQTASEAQADIPLGGSNINVKQVRLFSSKLRDLVDQGQGSIDPSLVLGFFPMTDDELAKINSAQYQPLTGTCNGNVCILSTTGSSPDGVQLQLSKVSLPGLGSPTLWAAGSMSFVIRLIDDDHLELCKVDGIKVQKYVWVPFDGALFDLSNNKYTIDVGLGGSYPKDC